jgi:hypothetical protein
MVMGSAAKHVPAGLRLCWHQWWALYGKCYEKHHALLRTGDSTMCVCQGSDGTVAPGPRQGQE